MLRSDEGSGPVSAIFGVAVFLGFMLFAVQVTTHLWATSAVTTAAFDGARLLAGERGFTSQAAAEDHVRSILGAYADPGRADGVRFTWDTTDPEHVALTVNAPTPARLIRSLGELAGMDRIERTVRVRVEQAP